MSKFVDNLKRACDAVPAPIGFLSRQPTPATCRMQLLATVAPEDLDRAAEFIKGADAVLLPVASENPPKKRLTGFANAAGDTPWGAWLKGKTADVPELAKSGCDFVVFSTSTTLTATADEKTGKIMEVEPSIADSLLRAVNNLPVDAVFVNDDSLSEGPIAWQQLIQFQRCAALLTKPILASIPADISSEELKLLWEAGIDGAVIDTEDLAPEKFKSLRKTMDETKFPPRGRRREKMEAILPRPPREPAMADHSEEEEE